MSRIHWLGLLFSTALWVFVLQYSTYLISSLFFDRIIKIAALTLLLGIAAYRHRPLTRRGRIVVVLFVVMLGTALVAPLFGRDPNGFVQLFKYTFGFLALPLLIAQFPVKQPPPRSLLLPALIIGTAFSIQAIAYLTSVLNELPITWHEVRLERDGNMPERSFGILGYGNTLGNVEGDKPYTRAQGWFLEPSTLGAFLSLPTFLALGFFVATRRARFAVCSVLGCAGIFSTFSLAAYLAVEAGILATFIVRPCPVERRSFRRAAVSLIVLGAAFLAAAQLTLHLMHRLHDRQIANGTTQIGWVLSRNPHAGESTTLVRDTFVGVLSLLASAEAIEPPHGVVGKLTALRIVGIGLGGTLGTHATNSPSAPIFWLMAGGIPAAVCAVGLQAYVLYFVVVPLLQCHDWRHRGVGAAYVAATIHGLSYGTWINPWYLLVLGLAINTADYLDAEQAAAGSLVAVAH